MKIKDRNRENIIGRKAGCHPLLLFMIYAVLSFAD